LAFDAFAIAVIALDYARFAHTGLEVGAVYRMMAENFSTDWVDWRLFVFWIIALPLIIATTQTSLHKARTQSPKPRRTPGRWATLLSRFLRVRGSLIVTAHLCLALLIAHCAQFAAAMQNLSGRSESVLGWGFQSYWASIVGFGSLFYASILVPAFQVAVVKILGFRIGIAGHGLAAEAASEVPIAGAHTHISVGGVHF